MPTYDKSDPVITMKLCSPSHIDSPPHLTIPQHISITSILQVTVTHINISLCLPTNVRILTFVDFLSLEICVDM